MSRLISIALWIAVSWLGSWHYILWITVFILVKVLFLSEKYLKVMLDHIEDKKQQAITAKDEYKKSDSLVVSDEIKEEEKREYEIDDEEEETYEKKEKKSGYQWSFAQSIKEFFSTNLLAKIGAIFVILWVVFLLNLVWQNAFAPVIKILAGFAVGLAIYIFGIILHKKDFKWIWVILMGTGILINYLVILWGRYLLWIQDNDSSDSFSPFLSSYLALALLIINTIFGVITALTHQSKTLLVFWFLCAYLNPFMVNWGLETPYFLLWYSMIITVAAYVIGINKGLNWFVNASLTLGILLVVISPSGTESQWLIKYIVAGVMALASGIVAMKNEKLNAILPLWIGYVAMMVLLIIWWINKLSLNDFYIVIVAVLPVILWLFSYYVSNKKEKSEWYLVWTIWMAVILFMSVWMNNVFGLSIPIISLVTIWLFALIYALYPFFNINFLVKLDSRFVIAYVIWTLWMASEVFQYGNVHLTSMDTGLAFLVVAMFFAVITYAMSFIWKWNYDQLFNSLYLVGMTAVSMLTIAIALIFVDFNWVVALIWLVESSLLLFLWAKLDKNKITNAWMLLQMIWIAKWFEFASSMSQNDYMSLIPMGLMLVLLIWNIFWLSKTKSEKWVSKSLLVLQFIGMLMVGTIFAVILSWGGFSWIDILWMSIYVVMTWVVYSFVKSSLLKILYLCGLCGRLLAHIIMGLDSGFGALWTMPIIMQYLASFLFLFLAIWWYKKDESKTMSHAMNTIVVIYLLTILSMYIYGIIPTTFAITIFWWLMAVGFLVYGIFRDSVTWRTFGLYILILAIVKIVCFDLRYGLNDALSRVIMFISLGGMLIFVSILYSKKYWNNLKGEFNLGNLFH